MKYQEKDYSRSPFLSNYDQLNSDQRSFVQSLNIVYCDKGYGEFLATFMNIKRGSLFTKERVQHIQYWILGELRIRYYAWKLCLKLRRMVLKTKQAQNDTLLDFTTPTQSLTDAVYVYVNNKYWIFSISEITNIFLASLRQRHVSEHQPNVPCNPYTNIQFTPSQMMNIYLQIGHLKLHPYIHNYAKRYFDIQMFTFFNKIELSNGATKEYLKTLHNDYLREIAEFFEYPFDVILKRDDIPVDVKRGFLKRVINNEPMKQIFDLPMCSLYNIHPFQYKTRHPRHTRRARRIPRGVTTQNWPILPDEYLRFDSVNTE